MQKKEKSVEEGQSLRKQEDDQLLNQYQHKVESILLNEILGRQFDMVAYLSNGKYGVIIGDSSLIEKGSIFPKERQGDYLTYLKSQVLPVLHGTFEEKETQAKQLRPEVIDQNLQLKNPYVVNIAVDINGEIYYKRFDFYATEPDSDFYVVLKSDITDIKREQTEINEKLSLALEEARQANVAKTAFLSRMSHELRTPMNAIIGLNNIALREKDLPETVRGYLEKIHGSAKHLLELMNDILDMSRIESGRMVLKKTEFAFNSFIDQINMIIDGQCKGKGLKYKCLVKGKLDHYYIGDDAKLKQVLLNILENSVKFTEPGGMVFMGIEEVASFEDQATIKFSLQDTGIGMDKEYLPRLFQAFSQEDATTTSKYEGTGLGLAITKNIIDMMDGTIRVSSEKGKGTNFIIEVTLKKADKEHDELDELIRPEELKLLIVTDNPEEQENAKLIFEEVGVNAKICSSTWKALEEIRLLSARREGQYLVLVDMEVQNGSGLAVVERIKTALKDENVVILLSAYNWLKIEEEAGKAGVDGFVSKPLFASNVLEQYGKIMRKRLQEEKEKKKKKVDLSGKCILVAEDVEVNAIIMTELLSMEGMEAEIAENGQIAVKMFSERPEHYYDAILMDVRMPVMDGLEATKEIRGMDREDCREIPIIAMTANAFDEDVKRSLHAGMNAHLTKPVDMEYLYSTLSEMIGE